MARSVYFEDERSVAVRERAVPDPGPGEVRVRTLVSAISPGTEGLIYRGQAPTDLPADETLDALDGDLSFPLQYGYAAVGDVTATGEGVADDWLDRTAFAFHPHESHFLADPDGLVPVPAWCDPADAALLPNVETAVNLVLDGQPRVGERVAVFGQGVVGLLVTSVLSSFPLADLVTFELRENRRAASETMGADESVDPTAVDPADYLRDRWGEAGPDLAYEVSGDPAALDDAVAAAGYDSRVVVGSWYGDKPAELDLGGRFHRDRVAVVSSQVSTLDPSLRGRWSNERRLDVAWDRLREVDAGTLVTHRLPVEDAPDAYRLLDEEPGTAVCVLLTYD